MKAFRLDLTPEKAAALAEELQGLVEIGLEHPSIVMPLAAGLDGHTVYLAEEYVAAESLDIALRHYAPAALETALPFLNQLAGAIDFARARGVGHGALHPRDIFLAPEIARATGFGIVQALERLGLRAPVRRPYSAPERVSGRAWSTPADVFALGAVAHELLTGKRAAGTGEVAAIAGKAAESHPDLLRGGLGRALAEDPAARFASAKGFVTALEAAARGEGAAPVEPARPEPARPAPARPAPARPAPVEGVEGAEEVEGARELELQLDREVAPAPELGDFDIRLVDEDRTFEVEREEEVEGEEPPAPEPEPERAAEPVETPIVSQKEGRRRASASRRRKRHEEEHETADQAEAREPQGASAPSLFDIAEQAPATGVVAADRLVPDESWDVEEEPEEAIEEPEELVEQAKDAIEEDDALDRAPVDDRLAPSARDYAPAEPVAVSARSAYMPAVAERSRPAILPFAIVGMVGLLAGFLAGYALGSREQKPSPADSAQSAPAPPAAAAVPSLPTPSLPTPSLSRGSRGSRGSAPASTPPSPSQKAWSEAAVEPAPAPPPRATKPAPARTPAVPAATTGTLVADSRPAGARVVLDGRVVGKTPLKLTGIKAGLHAVRLELDGYRPWTTEMTVTGGRETRVAGSLERIRNR